MWSSPVTEELSFQAVQNSSILVRKDLSFTFIPANTLSFIYSKSKEDIQPKSHYYAAFIFKSQVSVAFIGNQCWFQTGIMVFMNIY